MSKTFTVQQFEIEFYLAMSDWAREGKVGPDPRGEWEYQQISNATWHETFAPATPEWDLHAYRWKQPKKRTVIIDGVELVAPEVKAPDSGTKYYREGGDGMVYEGMWGTSDWDRHSIANGKLFLTREDCQVMADAQRKQRLGEMK